MSNFDRKPNQEYIETPLGIATSKAGWFHITTKNIREFVPGLLDVISLDQLVEDAIAWVRSGDSLAMTLILILFFLVHPIVAFAIALAFHFFWYRNKSAFVTIYLGKIFRFMNSDGYMLIATFLVISALGMKGHYLAASLGLVFFLLAKPGLLKISWDYLDKGTNAKLSLNDRVFKMILTKYAMRYSEDPAQVKNMEDQFVKLAINRKKKDK